MGKRVQAFPLRIPLELRGEVKELAFRHNLSLNLLHTEMIKFAYSHPSFIQMLESQFKQDKSRGHFVFIKDVRQ